MSNVNTDGLPPEMQQRIAQIIEGAKQKAVQAGVPSNTVQQQQGSPEQVAPSARCPVSTTQRCCSGCRRLWTSSRSVVCHVSGNDRTFRSKRNVFVAVPRIGSGG